MKNIFSIILVLLTIAVKSQNLETAKKRIEEASILEKENQPYKAVNKYKEALFIYSNANKKKEIGSTTYKIAFVYAARLGNWNKAEIWLNKTLSAAQNASDLALTARTYGNLGIIYDKTGRYKKSAEYHQKSLDLYTKMNNKVRIMLTHKNMGMLYLNKSNNRKALKHFSASLKMSEEMKDTVEMGRLTYNMGLLNYKRSRFGKALELYNKALKMLGTKISAKDKAELLNNLGTVYSEYSDSIAAVKSYEDALRIAKEIKNLDLQARILNNMGNYYHTGEKYMKAVRLYKESVDINERTGNKRVISITLNNIGIVLKKMNRINEAKEFYKRSREIKKSLGYIWGDAFLDLCYGELYIQTKENRKAISYLDSAIQKAKQIEAKDILYKTYAAYARAELNMKDSSKAMTNYEKSIELIEEIRSGIDIESNRYGFMSTAVPVYKELSALNIERGNIEYAFELYEKMKTRNLLEILNGAELIYESDLSLEIKNRNNEIETDLKNINREIAGYCKTEEINMRSIEELVSKKKKLANELNKIQNKINRNSGFKIKYGAGIAVDINIAGKLLKDETETAVAYMVTKNKTYAFILNSTVEEKTKINVVEIALTKEQIKLIASNIIRNWEIYQSGYLSKKLISPLLPYIKGKKTICFIPDSYLFNIPFHALKNKETDNFMIEDFAIYYDYSMSILKQLRDIKSSGKDNLLALGNPNFTNTNSMFPDKSFSELPQSAEEVKSIGEIYSNKSKILLQDSASEAKFKENAHKYNILHLATHGIIDNINPMFSSLILSPDSINDGILSAQEVMQMEIKADLVVLSACETAIGVITDGEGMLGMSRAFMGAKVPTIAASLWQVDDRSTKKLMEYFYKNIQNKDNYAEALRKAQINLMKNTRYDSPFFWAPFIVIGDVK